MTLKIYSVHLLGVGVLALVDHPHGEVVQQRGALRLQPAGVQRGRGGAAALLGRLTIRASNDLKRRFAKI